MKKFKVELTEEQLNAILAILAIAKVEWDYGEGTDTSHAAILKALQQAEPIQEKIWLPFTALKDGGTYLTRDGKEYTVNKHSFAAVYPYYNAEDRDNFTRTWAEDGSYDILSGESQLDLILELQPSEE